MRGSLESRPLHRWWCCGGDRPIDTPVRLIAFDERPPGLRALGSALLRRDLELDLAAAFGADAIARHAPATAPPARP